MPSDETEAFEHYRVLRRADGSIWELGRGAMGVTYKAIDDNLHKVVALKVINALHVDKESSRDRFLREARAAASLDHRNIAGVFHLGHNTQSFFYAMEFIDGETVEALVKRTGPLPWREALGIVDQVARALSAAHEKRLVHRDIKPANLMLVPELGEVVTVVKLIDFGLAKSLLEEGGSLATVSGSGFVGTPLYASPEQCNEDAPDIRSDIYSLGATLWFMLTGQPLFNGPVGKVFAQHLNAPPPLEQLPADVPASVPAVLGHMLAKDRADRPQTPADLRKELEACLREPTPAPAAAAVVVSATPPVPLPTLPTPVAEEKPRPLAVKPRAAARRFWLGTAVTAVVAALASFPYWTANNELTPPIAITAPLLAPTSTPAAVPTPTPAPAPTVANPLPQAALTKLEFAREAYDNKDYIEAQAIYRLALEMAPGCSEAIERLEKIKDYANQENVAGDNALETNPEAAVAHYRKAADLDDPGGLNNLACLYRDGYSGHAPQPEQAIKLFEQAAAQNNGTTPYESTAKYNLACMYQHGWPGRAPQPEKAVKLYQQLIASFQAAGKNHSVAQNNLGFMYQQGWPGQAPELEKAVKLFEQAAEHNQAPAQYNLGRLYEQGKGVPKDRAKAVDLYRLAAKQGHADAKVRLKALGEPLP